ncbi:prolipoprotein diacylglyceryl transferase [Catenovulum maritimum]|uniref:Phosphatidylglycerol--prolipoprotein diacylglyceryl transferase n=1 Tax=Catenovulum maritimum TaxID=1513271 RepID=A0A0J8GNH9_9ALTE|nr:prolipoprotein diacylglyceryl transferase [Catenovulum maritimum]KMT64355.1 prolipoprotein diacylglyceryl transferase [Catenovulum maritimum]
MNEYWIFPAIDPIIVSIGPIALRWYGLMYLLGFVGAMYFANRRVGQHDCYWNKEQISDFLFYGFLGVVLGGRIGYVLFYQFEHFISDPLYLFDIMSGGMSFHGGFLGVVAAMFWFAYKTNTKFLQVADFIAPMIPIGLFFGRIGNFINAELWGRQADVPWAIIFPNAGGIPRHPSQLYECILEGLVLFIILNLYRQKPRPVGAVAALFAIGYGSFRFIVEYFREPDAHLQDFMNGYITMGQLLSLPMVIVGLIVIVFAYTKNKSNSGVNPA